MPTYAPPPTQYEIAPAGLHPAVCVDVVDEGFKPTQFGDKHKVRFVFQIEEQNSKGYRHTVSAWFNLSMHENSSMRQFLEQWRGRPFSEKEINQPPGFDLESVIGKPCALNVVHNESGGKTYANISGVAQHSPRLGEPLQAENYVRVQDREESKAATAAANSPFVPEPVEDDDIPF